MTTLFRVKSEWWEKNAKGPWNRMVAELKENFTKSDPKDIFEKDPDGIDKVLKYKKSKKEEASESTNLTNSTNSTNSTKSTNSCVSESGDSAECSDLVSTSSPDVTKQQLQKNKMRYRVDPEYAERRRQQSRSCYLRRKQRIEAVKISRPLQRSV
jgi:hypothetical protein